MNFIRKIFSFIKNIFIKKDEVKKLEEPKIVVNQDNKITFVESLKTTITKKSTNNKVETLICNGDGLGIQNKISY